MTDPRVADPDLTVAVLTVDGFLLARIAEQREWAGALAVARETERFWAAPEAVAAYGLVNPGRVLAECEAKERVVACYRRAVGGRGVTTSLGRYEQGLLEAVRCLAEAYADHPEYDSHWRPS